MLSAATVLIERNGYSTDVILCQGRVCTATRTGEQESLADSEQSTLPVYELPTNVIDLWNYGV